MSDQISSDFELADGTIVELEELRLRQFLRLLRIVTVGAPTEMLAEGIGKLADDEGQFGANLLMLIMLGIPHAEVQVVDFLLSMVRPKGLVGGPDGKPQSRMTKQEIERDKAAYDALIKKLENPSLEDTLIIIEKVFKGAATDFRALGKRLAAMWKVAEKAGMLKSQESNSSTTQPVESNLSVASGDATPSE